MNSPEANELWREIAGGIVKQLKGEPVKGRYRFLSQVQIAPKDGRVTFTVGAMISETDYRYQGMSDRSFWLAMQQGDHWGAEFKAAGLSLEFSPNEDGRSVETITFWLTDSDRERS
jgi:hypothetical protein